MWAAIWIYILSIYLSLPYMRGILNTLKDTLGPGQLGVALNGALVVTTVCLVLLGVRRGWYVFLCVLIPVALVGVGVYQLDIPEERVHFLQYGLLGLLAARTARAESWRIWLYLTVFVILIGAGDELIQWLLPNRVGDLRDVAMNTVAGILGLWIGKYLFWDSHSSSAAS